MFLRYKHLKADHVVENRPQLRKLIQNYGFPPGFLLSPNVRVWTEEEVKAWIAERKAAGAKVRLKGVAKANAARSEARDAA